MYMVFELNGLQYDGMLGDYIEVDLLDNPEKELKIGKVMYLSNKEKGIHVGQPYLEGAEITALYEKDVKADKIIVFRFKPKKKFRKKKGHRQGYSLIRLTAVKFGDISLTKKDEAPAVKKKSPAEKKESLAKEAPKKAAAPKKAKTEKEKDKAKA